MFDFLKRKKKKVDRPFVPTGEFPLKNPVFSLARHDDGTETWYITFDLVDPNETIKHIAIGAYGTVGIITHE